MILLVFFNYSRIHTSRIANLLYLHVQVEMWKKLEIQGTGHGSHDGACAICLNKISLPETALVRGCEHAYWLVLMD